MAYFIKLYLDGTKMKIMNGMFAKLCLCVLTVMIWGQKVFARCESGMVTVYRQFMTNDSMNCTSACIASLGTGYGSNLYATWATGNCYCLEQCNCITGCPHGHASWSHASTVGYCNRSNCCDQGTIVSSCINAGPWESCASPYGGTYENRNVENGKYCSNHEAYCSSIVQYQCARGYYGSPTSCTAGCTSCPTYTTIYGTTDSGGATTASGNCYVSSSYPLGNSTGSFVFDSNCYYS